MKRISVSSPEVALEMFYIKPPRGQVSLHILESCVLARVQYLELLHCNNADQFDGKFEYLLENSTYDKIGHFTLRLLTAVHTDLTKQWIGKETLLFRERLKYISRRQLYRLFRKTEYESKNFINGQLLINKTLKEVCMFFSNPKTFRHIISVNHSIDCDKIQYKGTFIYIHRYLFLLTLVINCNKHSSCTFSSKIQGSPRFSRKKGNQFMWWICYFLLFAMEETAFIVVYHLFNTTDELSKNDCKKTAGIRHKIQYLISKDLLCFVQKK